MPSHPRPTLSELLTEIVNTEKNLGDAEALLRSFEILLGRCPNLLTDQTYAELASVLLYIIATASRLKGRQEAIAWAMGRGTPPAGLDLTSKKELDQIIKSLGVY